MTCSKDRRPPFGRPRIEKRTRHDLNVRPQASQTCALILLSYGFKRKDEGRLSDLHPSSGGGATRTHRGAPAPGDLARRCTTFCATPPRLSGRCGSRTHRSSRSDSFRDCSACPCPTFRRCIRGDSNPHAREERQLYRLLPDQFGV